MKTVSIHQAKTNLSRILTRVEMGEEFIIANRGIPVAKLVPFSSTNERMATLGMDKGTFVIPDNFDAPLPEEELAAFYGEES